MVGCAVLTPKLKNNWVRRCCSTRCGATRPTGSRRTRVVPRFFFFFFFSSNVSLSASCHRSPVANTRKSHDVRPPLHTVLAPSRACLERAARGRRVHLAARAAARVSANRGARLDRARGRSSLKRVIRTNPTSCEIVRVGLLETRSFFDLGIRQARAGGTLRGVSRAPRRAPRVPGVQYRFRIFSLGVLRVG